MEEDYFDPYCALDENGEKIAPFHNYFMVREPNWDLAEK
jgi:hypothetical protein